MEDFTTLISEFSRWLQARNLDPKDYSLAIVARDQPKLAALQGELNVSFQRGDWRPAWTTASRCTGSRSRPSCATTSKASRGISE